MAQPLEEELHHQEEHGLDPRAIALIIAATIAGTLYVVGLLAAASHINVPEALIDLSRAALITAVVSLLIRSGFARIAKLIGERSERDAEYYSLGYVHGVARKPPELPESARALHAVK